MKQIKEFKGIYFFLCNFAPSVISYNGKTYKTVEHFFQAMKATNECDHEEIRNAATPNKAKQLGRSIELRSDWEQEKDNVMLLGLRLKFAKGTILYQKLRETKEYTLIEGNTWHDRYWGTDPSGKHGENMLGKFLMKIRDEI